MIQRLYKQAMKANLDQVIVANENETIAKAHRHS
jgi:CMP-2-keto-3-deoxyoctulosonic acid synthetase